MSALGCSEKNLNKNKHRFDEEETYAHVSRRSSVVSAFREG